MYKVYFRTPDRVLGCVKVDDAEDHEDAILAVQESLVEEGVGYLNPVLVVINGGKV